MLPCLSGTQEKGHVCLLDEGRTTSVAWMDGRIDGWMDGWMDRWTDGQMDRWIDGRMDGSVRVCVCVHVCMPACR